MYFDFEFFFLEGTRKCCPRDKFVGGVGDKCS